MLMCLVQRINTTVLANSRVILALVLALWHIPVELIQNSDMEVLCYGLRNRNLLGVHFGAILRGFVAKQLHTSGWNALPSFSLGRDLLDLGFVEERNLLLLVFILDFEGSRSRPLNIVSKSRIQLSTPRIRPFPVYARRFSYGVLGWSQVS